MYNFWNYEKKPIQPILKPLSNNMFIFPINGINIPKLKQFSMGYVTFMDKSIAIRDYYNSRYSYPVSCYALVDLRKQKFSKVNERGLNSVALKIYYITNEIYVSERIIKYFIVLNNIFREGNKELNRIEIAKLLNIVCHKITKVNIFNGNFNGKFEKLYDNIRNNVMHGKLDLENEENAIISNDYFNLKRLFYVLIIVFGEDNTCFRCKSTTELKKYINSLNIH